MTIHDITIASLALGMILTLGGCYCCSTCSLCADNLESIQFDVTFPAADCTGGGCDDISGTYVVDIGTDCCASYETAGFSCDTAACAGCSSTPNGGGIVCCENAGYECSAYYISLGEPSCSPDANSADCSDTEGCSSGHTPKTTGSDVVCVSDITCEGVYGVDDPGYSCERIVTCTDDCTCASVQGAMNVCLENQGGDIHAVGVVSDGWRSWEFDENLGTGDTVDCLDVISGLIVTLTEVTAGPLSNHLCGTPTLTLTGM